MTTYNGANTWLFQFRVIDSVAKGVFSKVPNISMEPSTSGGSFFKGSLTTYLPSSSLVVRKVISRPHLKMWRIV
ncbi:hypothetical protein ABMA28_012491 [Loxostege sticticalis]|uniref:Uncharacterized protein n=1 Tax=Loxostege sticticalis TaxID=481309 RepID=A0ABD0S6A1_LOXSC